LLVSTLLTEKSRLLSYFSAGAAHSEQPTGPVSNSKTPVFSGISENEFSKKFVFRVAIGEVDLAKPHGEVIQTVAYETAPDGRFILVRY